MKALVAAFAVCFLVEQTAGIPTCKLDPTGVDYRGNLSQTLSGRTCQRWTAQYPHEHSRTPSEYPNKGLGAHNYCRNPDDVFTAWCYTTDPEVRWEYCAVGDFDPECTIIPLDGGLSECYTLTNATDYRGNISVSRNGHICQKWTTQTPHEHNYPPADYPNDGLGDHNLCRNPGGSADMVWCYTTSPTRWEFCNIAVPQDNCNRESTTPETTSVDTPTFSTEAATTEAPQCQRDPSGANYRGDVSHTVSGHTCQKWTLQTPHEHTRTPEEYPNSGLGDHNYCRNVGASSFTAWCYTTDPDKRWEYCPVGSYAPRCMGNATLSPSDCYSNPYATDYRGTISSTRSGYTCQAWTSQYPHEHSRTPSEYPDTGIGEHNYCRNPDTSDMAWCYTNDPSIRWEYCNVGIPQEKCEEEQTTASSTTSPADIVRLSKGPNSWTGLVEILVNGEWGTICDDQWGLDEASTVCRMLGYREGAIRASVRAEFGSGLPTAPIWLDDVDCLVPGDDILECEHRGVGVHNCQHGEDAGVECKPNQVTAEATTKATTEAPTEATTEPPRETTARPPIETTARPEIQDIRLVDGGQPHQGRVEILHNDEWGTVCDDVWDENDASVVCRMLGYATGAELAPGNAYFGAGTGPTWLDNVRCAGDEASLANCEHRGFGREDCTHSEDAGVVCRVATTPSSTDQSSVINSQGGNFTLQDGDVLRISSPNYPAHYDSSTSVPWKITMPEHCTLVLDVLNFHTEGHYDTLSIGHGSVGDLSIERFSRYLDPFSRTYTATFIWIHFVSDLSIEYSGFEAQLRASCESETNGTTSSTMISSEQTTQENLIETTTAGQTTQTPQTPQESNELTITLASHGSRVNISSPNYPGQYPPSLDKVWTIFLPASCALRGHFYSFTTERSFDSFKVGFGRYTYGVKPRYSFDGADLPEDFWLDGETLWIKFHSDGSIQGPGFFLELEAYCSSEATTAFQENTNGVTSEAPWTVDGNVDSTGGPIALVEGEDYYIGSPNFPSNYPSDTTILWQVSTPEICSIDITFIAFSTEPIYDYLVVGSQDVTPKNLVRRWTGGDVPAPLHVNSNQVWLLFMSDSGTEEQGFVAKLQAVCSNSSASVEEVRLVGGDGQHEGRLEILYNGQWGTVCSDLWEQTNAEVVCRMLGYEGAESGYSTSDLWWFTGGSGPIWMDNVHCQGNEVTLDECNHLGLGVHNCDHSKDVGVICRTGSQAVTNTTSDSSPNIRLVNGSRPNEGRVEVFRGRGWGTVCDDYWGIEDAHVVCRMLGYESAEVAYGGAEFGEGTGAILLDDVACTGTEPNLFSCEHNNFADCSHAEDAGVKCFVTV